MDDDITLNYAFIDFSIVLIIVEVTNTMQINNVIELRMIKLK